MQKGGIILYPTDTVWGIGCDATNSDAIKKIYQVKNREEKKTMIILLAHESDIAKYVYYVEKKIIDFISIQKKPTTAIFNEAINLPDNLINPDGSIAIRIVKDDFCKTLIQQLNKPIVSTSANISGETTPGNFEMISTKIKKEVDYIVTYRQDDKKIYQSSSIIKLNEINEIEKIR